MSINVIPKVLYQNKITEILDEMRENYGKLTRKGFVYGLLTIDQDAKIIAVDSRFDRKLNYWDLSSIGAALYGVSRQGQDFFDTDYLERASIIYNNLQLFVKSIGEVNIQNKGKREILVVLLADKEVNIGVIILQMNRFGQKIKKIIENSGTIKKTLKMTEKELKEHIKKLKKEIFKDKIGSIS
ncbi:MAG: roadblock/LC7 domain-containing protein [Candidatus Hermodarchaeota archaeon]